MPVPTQFLILLASFFLLQSQDVLSPVSLVGPAVDPPRILSFEGALLVEPRERFDLDGLFFEPRLRRTEKRFLNVPSEESGTDNFFSLNCLLDAPSDRLSCEIFRDEEANVFWETCPNCRIHRITGLDPKERVFSYTVETENEISGTLLRLEQAEDETKDWRLRAFWGRSSYSTLQEILVEGRSNYNFVEAAGLGVDYVVIRDFLDWPIDILLSGSIIQHQQGPVASDILELNGGFTVELKKFPWSTWVGTRLAVEEGLSWTDGITHTESFNTVSGVDDGNSRFLNYLGLRVSVCSGDIFGGLGEVVPFLRCLKEPLKNVWIEGGVSHRSGVFGTFNGVRGGSNVPFIGIYYEM